MALFGILLTPEILAVSSSRTRSSVTKTEWTDPAETSGTTNWTGSPADHTRSGGALARRSPGPSWLAVAASAAAFPTGPTRTWSTRWRTWSPCRCRSAVSSSFGRWGPPWWM